MADEKRQIILDLLARNQMSRGTKEAADDLDHLGRTAEETDKKTTALGKSSEEAAGKAEKLGHSVEQTRGKIGSLDKEIENTKKELGSLAHSFADAGSAAERLDISKAIRRTQGELRNLKKNKGFLQDILPDENDDSWRNSASALGKKIGSFVVGGITDAVSGNPALAIGLTAALVVVGPTVGSAIGAAIVGAAGAGGLIGGVALALKSDDTLKARAADIGSTFVEALQSEAKDALSGPIEADLGKIQTFLKESSGKLGALFEAVAPYLDPLVTSLTKFGDAIEGGLVYAAQKAGPVMAELGKILEDTGNSLGELFIAAADNSETGASALDDFNSVLQFTIHVLTGVVEMFSMFRRGISDVGDAIGTAKNWLEDHTHYLDLTADGYKKGSEAADLYRKGIIGAAGSVNDYDHYLHPAIKDTNTLGAAHTNAEKAALGQRDALDELAKELKAQQDPAFALLAAQDALAAKQKALTTAVKKYGGESTQAKTATRELAEAALDLEGKAGALGKGFSGELTPQMIATYKAAGLTDRQIRDVAKQFRNAKADGDAFAKLYKATVVTNYVNRFAPSITDAATAAYNSTKKSLGKRAAGGPTDANTAYVVGENGPEIWMANTAGRVLNASASRGLMSRAASRGSGGDRSSGGARALELRVVGDDPAIVSLVKRLIRTANVLE